MTVGAANVTTHHALREQQVRSILACAPGAGRNIEITGIRVTAGAYRSSYLIEDVEISFSDGGIQRAVLKDVSPGSLYPEARRAKPTFLLDARREIEVYRNVLRPFEVGAPAMFGAIADEATQCYVLLLESVQGMPLWQVGNAREWCAAAQWLATMHVQLERFAPSVATPARLLDYDEGYYALWRGRADASLKGAQRSAESRRLLDTYCRVIPLLLALPRTFIHGEFHASNVLVESGQPTGRIRPVDWETAAFAPALMDLADLTAGKWTTAQRESLTVAYRDAVVACGAVPSPRFEFELDCCRLHRAVQWLSWSAGWLPPREHAQDWYAEASRVCDRIALTDVLRTGT